MQQVNLEKKVVSSGGLRLVSDNKNPQNTPSIEKQFVSFIFLRVANDWRKLSEKNKREFKKEFAEVYGNFDAQLLSYSYSLIGFDSKADLMFWRIGDSLDTIQEMTAKLYRTNLGGYLETTDNYLSVTKRMMFLPFDAEQNDEDRYHVRAGAKKYHFVYPRVRENGVRGRSGEERSASVEENFMVGKRFENIKIHLTHAFGFNEQEYIVSFETDDPKHFLALAEELRENAGDDLATGDTPIYTCRQRDLIDCLNALG